MQFERRRDGVRYVVEAYGPDREVLEQRRKALPGSRVEYDVQGLLLRDADGRACLTGPVYILWRPDSSPEVQAAPPTPPAPQLTHHRHHHRDPKPGPSMPILRPGTHQAPRALRQNEPSNLAPQRYTPQRQTPQQRPAGESPVSEPPQRYTPQRQTPQQRPADDLPAIVQERCIPATLAAPHDRALPELEDPADFLAELTPEPAAPFADSPTSSAPTPRLKNVTRVDRPSRNAYGYHVRLGWKGAVYQKWFSDATYDSQEAALAAALTWRDAKERELGKPRTERLLKGRDRTSNTGIVGVALVAIKGRPYYRALWRDPEGKMRRRWFSIDELGEEQALSAAIAAHKEGIALRLQ